MDKKLFVLECVTRGLTRKAIALAYVRTKPLTHVYTEEDLRAAYRMDEKVGVAIGQRRDYASETGNECIEDFHWRRQYRRPMIFV